MAAVIQAKTRRSIARCRATKLINTMNKLHSDDIRELPSEELKRKLELFKAAVKEELDAQEHLLGLMATESASEEELQREIDGNSVIEDTYDDHLDRMTDSITKHSYFLLYQELKSTTDSWLKHGVPSSTEYATTGSKIVEGMQGLIRSLIPHAAHPTLGTILTEVKSQLELVQIALNKKASVTTVTPVPEATSYAKKPAPYQIKAPTFSGKPTDFQPFFERFSEVLKTHWESYSDGDRCCILAEAMQDPAAKELVESYAPAGYDTAMKQLKERYGRAAAVYPKFVEDLVSRGRYE